MTIKIWGPALSTHVARVLATLFEKDVIDYELLDIDMMNGDHKTPEYLALQPFGEVPVMVDGSLTLFESRAIARFLADKFEGQGTPLYGSTPKDKALVEQWLEVESQTFHPLITRVLKEKIGKELVAGLKPDQAAILLDLQKLGKILDVYEVHLTNNKYLAGDFFSLADLSHLPDLNGLIHTSKIEDAIISRPHVKAWWEDVSTRPAWKKVHAMIQHDLRNYRRVV